MLSPAQDKKHWRRWKAVVHANDWRMVDGRLDEAAAVNRTFSIYHALVWRMADALALRAHRAVTDVDLRHACYVLATTNVPGWGASCRPKDSIKDLGNREFSRLLCLWGDEKEMRGLLIDPDCLDSSIAWDHPEKAAAASLDVVLRARAKDETLRAISTNAFGTRLWEDLDARQKRWLLVTVSKPRAKTESAQCAVASAQSAL